MMECPKARAPVGAVTLGISFRCKQAESKSFHQSQVDRSISSRLQSRSCRKSSVFVHRLYPETRTRIRSRVSLRRAFGGDRDGMGTY